jgi:hypothetical protein
VSKKPCEDLDQGRWTDQTRSERWHTALQCFYLNDTAFDVSIKSFKINLGSYHVTPYHPLAEEIICSALQTLLPQSPALRLHSKSQSSQEHLDIADLHRACSMCTSHSQSSSPWRCQACRGHFQRKGFACSQSLPDSLCAAL